MRVHWFQHVPCEGLGMIESWIHARGDEAVCTRLFAGEALPDPDDVDFLIIMGGPMSVNDEDEYRWLVEEKQVVREVIQAGKPVFGVCLGAQMIVSALGGRVYPGPQLEVGWFPVSPVPESRTAPFFIAEEVTVLHWHGETFDLPEGSLRLASSEVCPNQAFLLGDRVIGTQFHFEASVEVAEGFLRDSYDGLSSSEPYIQTPEEIRSGARRNSETIQAELNRLLNYLASS